MSLKKPSELFEQRRLQSLAEEAAKKEEGEVKNKKIASPKELFGEVVEVEEPSIVEEVVEEPVDPYLEEIDSLRDDLERISYIIPEETDLTEVYQDIENLKDRIDNLPKQKSYDEDIQSIREELERIEDSIPVPEVFDPSDLYENISALKNKLEEVRSEIPTIPEPILYDYQLDQLKEMVVDVRNSIPVVPEIRYYENELNQKIANVKESIPVVPEVKYYDKDVKELKEQIASVKKSIPEVKYYDKDVKELRKEIASVKESIPVVPEVKYYDEDIRGLNEEVQDLYKKVSSIKIPDQDKYIKEVKGLYSSFEEKNHRLLEKINPEVKNSDPLTPLDQNFVTLTQLQEHYRLFINRIQQQLASIGGGGETRLEFLDDVDRDSAKVNGRFLKYDAASGKWIGALGGGGGSQTLDDTLGLGNTSSLGMSVGLTTVTKLVVDPIGSGVSFTEDLVVKGNARVTGILSIGTGTITIDGNSNTIKFSDNTLQYSAWTGIATVALGLSGTPNITVGIVTATKYYGDGSSLTGINAGGISSTSSINTTGIITANSYYVGSTQVINSVGQWVGSGLSVYSNIDAGVPNSVYGGIPVIDGGVP